MTSDCGGWWCDEWMCDLLWCTYKYTGLVDVDDFSFAAFAASIAIPAYFEGRTITNDNDDMDKCTLHILYWRENIREVPVDQVRSVCCGQYQLPCCMQGQLCYKRFMHMKRAISTVCNDDGET
jgi:hypothetical protein